MGPALRDGLGAFSGDPDDADDQGICIYLDGMSGGLHGDPATAARDQEIRSWLRNQGYQVIEITSVELDDRKAMIRHFKKLARFLEGRDFARHIERDSSWFDAAAGGFGEPAEDLQSEQQWVEPRTTRRLGEGMFVAQVHGQSMPPRRFTIKRYTSEKAPRPGRQLASSRDHPPAAEPRLLATPAFRRRSRPPGRHRPVFGGPLFCIDPHC